MKKIAVVGYKGKIGGLIYDELKKNYMVYGIDRENSLSDFSDIDLVIDFASHESSLESAYYCLKKKLPLIIGSTGQTVYENEIINKISREIAIVRKSNFSEGINLLKRFIEEVLLLNPRKFEVIEKHHINKKDAPSGTACDLKNYIQERFFGEVEVKSIREGLEMGEHKIIADLENEKLTIVHNVYSREAFVKGVKRVVEKLLN